MKFPILLYVVLFAMPMACVLAELRSDALNNVGLALGLVALFCAAVVLVPRLLKGVFRRRQRFPSARALASLDWPESLNRSEMETFCAAWLRGQGWQVTLASEPGEDAAGVYLKASRGGAMAAVLCDARGEDLNPADIRAFALAGKNMGSAHLILLTLPRRKLPLPAEAAARQAGVTLLRVADLPQINGIVPAASPSDAAPAGAPVAA